MSELFKLKAPAGADEANFGEVRYRVDNDGTITVPKEAAEYFVGVGGFELVKESQSEHGKVSEMPEGHIRVMHPDGTGASWGGTSYEPNPDGTIYVPAAAVIDLGSHGFEVV